VARRPPRQRLKKHAPSSALHLVSVAFNNPTIVDAQVRMIECSLAEEYTLTIADNSSARPARSAIRALCASRGIDYFPLPRNPYTGRDASRSHAEALNYVARHLPGLAEAAVVGFLDHDVFPTEGVAITNRIGPAGFYGRRKEGRDCWYLWPGLIFVRTGQVPLRSLDFRPVKDRGDTGAGIYFDIYQDLDPDSVTFCESTDRAEDIDGHRIDFEMHDEWIHTANGSYWKAQQNKDRKVVALLERNGLRDAARPLDSS